MKVYVGIRQTNSHIYMAALNSQGNYRTDFFPEEEPYAPADPYSDAILLAILDSLDQ